MKAKYRRFTNEYMKLLEHREACSLGSDLKAASKWFSVAKRHHKLLKKYCHKNNKRLISWENL